MKKGRLISFLSRFIYLGIDPPRNSFDKRITIITNVHGLFTLVTVTVYIFTLEKLGVEFRYYIAPLSLVTLAGVFILLFNGLRLTLWARLSAVAVANFTAWQAAIIYGKSFNGHYAFFAALFYGFVALYNCNQWLRRGAAAFCILSMVLNDYLYHQGILPVTSLNSSQFSPSLLFFDTLVACAFIILLIAVEKNQSQKYEASLEKLNQNLEEVVKKRTDMLLKAKEESVQVSLMKAQFVANTSHELRIPLQGVLGFSELSRTHLEKIKEENPQVAETKSYGRLEKSLQSSQKAAIRLNTLIGCLLQLTEAGQKEISAQPVHFHTEQIFQYLEREYKQLIEANRLKIEGDRQIECHSDLILVQQVLYQLISNAIDYSVEEALIQIQVEEVSDDVQMRVINQGVGVPESEYKKIFEPFYQGERTENRTGGLGLGLSLSQKYAKMIKGSILLESGALQRTCFLFTFPKRKEAHLSEPHKSQIVAEP